MVVDDDTVMHGLQQLLAGGKHSTVMVDDNQKALVRNIRQRLLLANHDIQILRLVIGKNNILVIQHLSDTPIISVMLALDDIGRLAQRQAQLRHADGRTDSVIVLIHMSHDKNLIRLLHLLVNRLSNDTCAYTRTLGADAARAAEELRVLILKHNSLVAAASQGQIKALVRVADKLLQRYAVAGHTNAHRWRNLVAAADFAHTVKNHKLVVHHIQHCRLRKAQKAALLVHAADKALMRSRPLRQQLVDFAVQIGDIRLAQAAHNLLVVVEAHIGQTQAVIIIFLAQQLIVRDIRQIQHQAAGCIRPFAMALLRLHAVILHIVIAVFYLQRLLAVMHAEQLKGIRRQRQNLLRLQAVDILLAHPLREQRILPLQLAILRKDSHTHIQLAHSKMVGAFNVADNVIQITAEENFLIDDIAAAEIVNHAKDKQRRQYQLRLQIADNDRKQHDYQQIDIGIHLGVYISVESIEHSFHLTRSGT